MWAPGLPVTVAENGDQLITPQSEAGFDAPPYIPPSDCPGLLLSKAAPPRIEQRYGIPVVRELSLNSLILAHGYHLPNTRFRAFGETNGSTAGKHALVGILLGGQALNLTFYSNVALLGLYGGDKTTQTPQAALVLMEPGSRMVFPRKAKTGETVFFEAVNGPNGFNVKRALADAALAGSTAS
jgi:hypothetical protein